MSKFWVQTYTGKPFDVIEPSPDTVDPYDIAVSLADKPRYSRHTRIRITVGQHSIMCAAAAYRLALAEGLDVIEATRRARLLALHDAAEAYIGDVLGPARMAIRHLVHQLIIKHSGAQTVLDRPMDAFDVFQHLEEGVARIIFKRFGYNFDALTAADRALIVQIDRRQLLFEKKWFVQTPEPKPWNVDGSALELSLFDAGVESPERLEQARTLTRAWDFDATVAAYMLTLERLRVIPQTWAGDGGMNEYPDYFAGYPTGYDIVCRLFPT